MEWFDISYCLFISAAIEVGRGIHQTNLNFSFKSALSFSVRSINKYHKNSDFNSLNNSSYCRLPEKQKNIGYT